MYKEIRLKCSNGEEKAYKFLSSGATAYRYRQVFHEDLMLQLRRMTSFESENANENNADSTVLDKLAFIMNAQAEGKDMKALNFDSFVDWAEDLESGELLTNAGEILNLYMGSKISQVTAKKN